MRFSLTSATLSPGFGCRTVRTCNRFRIRTADRRRPDAPTAAQCTMYTVYTQCVLVTSEHAVDYRRLPEKTKREALTEKENN